MGAPLGLTCALLLKNSCVGCTRLGVIEPSAQLIKRLPIFSLTSSGLCSICYLILATLPISAIAIGMMALHTHKHTHTLTNNMCLSLDSKELYISVSVACSQRSQSFSSSSEPWVFSIPSSTWQSRALNVWPPDWRAGKGARVQPGGATVPKALLECSSSSGSL